MRIPLHRTGDGSDDPFAAEFAQLREPFLAQLERWPGFPARLPDVLPALDLEETDEAYLLDVELPGVRPEEVSVEVSGTSLVVTGERRQRRRTGLLHHGTRTIGRLLLHVPLPSGTDTGAVSASLEDGLLTVVLPKSAAARPRRITVSTGQR